MRKWYWLPTSRGSIGSQVACLLTTVGMRVDGAGRRRRPGGDGFAQIHSAGDLLDHVGVYDYVIVTAALTDATRHLINANVLRAMRSTARLINVARGAIVDEPALDVFEVEPLPRTSPLWRMPNVIITPHMAGDYAGWRECQYEVFLQNFARFRSGSRLHNELDKSLGYVLS